LGWAAAAWLAWLALAWSGALWPGADRTLGRYLALGLTGCSGVAVLGARRPGAGAWNVVVGGLLAVLLLPVAEGLGEPRLTAAHLVFLGVTLAVGVLNYLPTTLGPAALCVGGACATELGKLAEPGWPRWVESAGLVLAGVGPWVALACVAKGRRSATEFDSVWRGFRDRFGFVWGQRLREQFNRAAANAGWPLVLGWRGLRTVPGGRVPEPPAPLATLHALLKRFGAEEDNGAP
jgi:hypothetical protein